MRPNHTMGEVVLGISGASGAIYGVRLAHVLNELGIGIRLVVSDSGRITLKHECDTTPEELAESTGALLEEQANIGAKSASVLLRLMPSSSVLVQVQHSGNSQLELVTISSHDLQSLP